MKLDNYALQQLAPFMTGHKDHGANFTGRELLTYSISMEVYVMYMIMGCQ